MSFDQQGRPALPAAVRDVVMNVIAHDETCEYKRCRKGHAAATTEHHANQLHRRMWLLDSLPTTFREGFA